MTTAVAYKPREASRLSKAAASDVGVVVEGLARAGNATPQALVDAARDPISPAHKWFEWDDAKAGEQYRVMQARHYLRSITVEYATEELPPVQVRAFVPVYVDGQGRAWKPMHEVLAVQSDLDQVIETARAEMHAFRQKYAELRRIEAGSALLRAMDSFLAAE